MARSKSVIELDDYFNSPRFAKLASDEERWAILTEPELDAIVKEVERCRESFVHCAQNWFWISAKSGQKQLFDLWDGQLLVVEKMMDMKSRGKPQWVVVIKSRQLGLSQLGCALGAHKCFFNSNQNGLIISEDDKKTENLWQDYTVPIYRQLPWFMKPVASKLTQDDGIVLNTDIKKSNRLGLESSLKIVSANSSGYVGQGKRLNFFHGSEFTSWPEFNDVIERGIENALFEDRDTVAMLESTAKGSGTATHAFWNKMSRMGDTAPWEPVFLPFFTDKTHVMAPHPGWVMDERYEKRRSAIKANWVRCDSKACKRYFNRIWGLQDTANTKCRFCKIGTFKEFVISDEQLYWMWNREERASDAKIIQQEQAISAEEAFLNMGDKVFSDAAIEWASHCVQIGKKPECEPIVGTFDRHGVFHGWLKSDPSGKCIAANCTQDHRKEIGYYTIWEKPLLGREYYIGGDVSEGLGKDYHVFTVLKKSDGGEDYHVATYRENISTPYDLAFKVNHLGRWYNNAQVAIEYVGGGQSTADVLLNTLQYPNIYTRKISGDFNATKGQGRHWLTNVGTKPKLISFMERWLREAMLIFFDPILLEELRLFVRETGSTQVEKDKKRAAAASGYHDDYIMSMMIALYTAHQNDYDEDGGVVPVKVDQHDPDTQAYIVDCQKCGKRVGISDPQQYRRCLGCNSMNMVARRNSRVAQTGIISPYRDIAISAPGIFNGLEEVEKMYEDGLNGNQSYLSYW